VTKLGFVASALVLATFGSMATHYVARELIALGHDVRQVPWAYAKAFRQTARIATATRAD
jgi:transposase